MKEARFEQVFECDPDTYWDKMFFDEEFNRSLFIDQQKYSRYEVTSLEKTDGAIKRVVEVEPPAVDMPSAIKKITGGNLGYTEHGTWDRSTKRYTLTVKTQAIPKKIRISGEVWLEPLGEKRCRRIGAFKIEVKIMLVGKVAEGLLIKSMDKEFSVAADFTNQWIRDKGL